MCPKSHVKAKDDAGNEYTIPVESFQVEPCLLTTTHYYDSLTYMDLTGHRLSKLPDPLPSKLQILIFDNNAVLNLPRLPSTLRMLSGRTNKITCLPDMSHCVELESIDLFDNNILEISGGLPPNLRTLDVSYTRLRRIAYETLPRTLVSLHASFCFLTTHPPEDYRRIVRYDHNNIPEQMYTANYMYNEERWAGQVVTTPTVTKAVETKIYGDAQNVHASSIQSSVDKSLTYVLKYESPVASKRTKRDHCREVCDLFAWRLFAPWSYRMSFVGMQGLIRMWCECHTIHSRHGITFDRLLSKVWDIIQDHEHRKEMEKVLRDELIASRAVCFTGRFSRVLNCLTGFVPEVQIGIDDREQMQNQISMAVEKLREDPEALRREVDRILDEFDVSPSDRTPWLSALEDL